MTPSKGALSGVRVLDLTRVLAGPFSGQILGDLGAEVIKVERPGGGDDGRHYGFSAVMDKDGNKTLESSFFISANRNKKSVTANLAKPEGQALVRQLAIQSDVLIENYKVGDLARYGLDYAAIQALNPGAASRLLRASASSKRSLAGKKESRSMTPILVMGGL